MAFFPPTSLQYKKYQNEIAIGKCLLSKQLRKALDVFSFFFCSKDGNESDMKEEVKSKLNTIWNMCWCFCSLL